MKVHPLIAPFSCNLILKVPFLRDGCASFMEEIHKWSAAWKSNSFFQIQTDCLAILQKRLELNFRPFYTSLASVFFIKHNGFRNFQVDQLKLSKQLRIFGPEKRNGLLDEIKTELSCGLESNKIDPAGDLLFRKYCLWRFSKFLQDVKLVDSFEDQKCN